MIAIDTNVLVRLLVNDSASQTRTNMAKALLKSVKQLFTFDKKFARLQSVKLLEQ